MRNSKIIEVEVELQDYDLLHVGTIKDPLSGKDNPIFKIGDIPAIPASSFKGALRYQLECLLIRLSNELTDKIIKNQNNGDKREEIKRIIKPCIPAIEPTYAEKALVGSLYRKQYEDGKLVGSCFISVDTKKVLLPKYKGDLGICPVCYFLGARGLPGFVRIYNFVASNKSATLSHPILRLDRMCNTSAHKALAEAEYAYSTDSDNNKFYGKIEIILEDKIRNFRFGDARKIEVKERDNENNKEIIIDKWLDEWKEDIDIKKDYLEELLLCAIKNIKELGGYKSKGCGKVNITKVNITKY